MATSSVSNSTVSQSLLDAMNGTSSTSSSSGTTAQDIQDRFMTMLVAQMKNQDPLNPMDNSEVTSQMAQLSSVSGIEQLNTTMQSLMSNYQTSQNLQASNLIGHGILTAGSGVTLSSGQAGMGVNLAASADSVTVDIYDAAGTKVNSVDLGAESAGITSFTWDGTTSSGSTAPDGQYTFKVTATNAGQAVTATALQFGVVSSVSFNGTNGITLSVPGMNDVKFSDVQQVL
jgi:flagellar basal-body rod modification protein FlgD